MVQLTGQIIASFADSQLTDALKHLAADPGTDHKVKKKLAAAEAHARDFDYLKKQSEAQQKEYDRLATELNKKTGAASDKRKD